jgi:peptidoglycan hydrolase CwlO-like protein
VLLAVLPATVSADSSSSLRDKASSLSQQNTNLASRSRGVVLQLYALDSRLAHEQARLVELRIRSAQVKADLAAARRRLHAARHTLTTEQRSLATRLQLMYEQGDTDPLAVVLGASSVADALGNLDSLDRIASQDREIIVQTRAARRTADGLTHTLAQKPRSRSSRCSRRIRSRLPTSRASRTSSG